MSQRQHTTQRTALTFFMDALLLFLALGGAVTCFFTSFGIRANFAMLLPLFVLLALVSCGVFSLPCGRAMALAVLGAGLAAAVEQLWPSVRTGGWAALAAAQNLLAKRLVGFEPVPSPIGVPTALTTLFLALAAAVLALALGWAIVRRRSALLTVLLTLPLLLPALLAEAWPWWPALMALAACWITLALCALSGRRAPAETGRLAACALPATVALLTLLSVLLPPQTYTQPDWAIRAYGRLVDTGDRLVGAYQGGGVPGLVSGLSLTAGSSETENLAAAGPRRVSGKTMLRVTAQQSGTLYLRGCSSGRYTGTGWEPLSEAAYGTLPAFLALQRDGQPLLFPARTQSPQTQLDAPTITVENLRAPGRFVYAPYQLAWDEAAAHTQFDRDVGLRAEGGVRQFTLCYQPPALADFQGLTGAAQRAELAYRAFVYQNYLELPPDFAVGIAPWQELADQAGKALTPAPAETLPQFQAALDTAGYWAALLGATARYDLNTPATPAGADFVRQFLCENQRGYCVHFATAATLLLRMSGIPARYVTGFLADVQPGQNDVTDASAHAWTEIYLDGYGWYPIDATPAAAPAAPVVPDVPDGSPAAPPTDPTDPTPAAPSVPAARWPLALPVSAALLAALPLRRRLALYVRRRRMQPQNPNGAAIAAYGWLTRLLPWGAQTTPECERLARRAKFSQHTLTPAECETVLSQLRIETARLNAVLPLPKRLVLRYFWALI